MNLFKPLGIFSRLAYSLTYELRMILPRQRSNVFRDSSSAPNHGISQIYVINLDRQPERLARVLRELNRITDNSGQPLTARTIRHPAQDGLLQESSSCEDSVIPFYTLRDQLFVEPQPEALPNEFALEKPIEMSAAEIAIAKSHIEVWKKISASSNSFSLILEDDISLTVKFADRLNEAWADLFNADQRSSGFDILYLSYKEAKYGAPKELLSRSLFRPERGLWFLSGYVLSKTGAQKLLKLLPCYGPIDLWINHKFKDINVRAIRKPVINQRPDTPSTNYYSILPALSQIGVIDSGNSALFHQRPSHFPVFAFGPKSSASTSLAMALSMLGYRCCSEIDTLPKSEYANIMRGSQNCIFSAYVNIDSLATQVRTLVMHYPSAKFIFIDSQRKDSTINREEILEALKDVSFAHLNEIDSFSWTPICDYLKIAPPAAPYPKVNYSGQRKLKCDQDNGVPETRHHNPLSFDASPWVVERGLDWRGISASGREHLMSDGSFLGFEDNLRKIDSSRWLVRTDTFPGNLGLFRTENVTRNVGKAVLLQVKNDPLGVRDFSAAAISSRQKFCYGRFEATFQATKIPGLVTGFFLHRNSPRQEIDIEITGNKPDQLLVNVFYNPGAEGARFDYGYLGTPTRIALGFDASLSPHKFAIEWSPGEIRWYVDEKLVCRRVCWEPTPIPNLPMTLHLNTWPSKSHKLAGRLQKKSLPASARVYKVSAFPINAALLHRKDRKN